MSLPWSDEYNLGFTQIDTQHREFVNTLNSLYDAITTSAPITPIFDKIEQYITYHFQTEESYFSQFDYPGAAEHIAQHQLFVSRIKSLRQELVQDQLTVSFELTDFLENWLVDHLNTMDKLYTDCFRAHGLK